MIGRAPPPARTRRRPAIRLPGCRAAWPPSADPVGAHGPRALTRGDVGRTFHQRGLNRCPASVGCVGASGVSRSSPSDRCAGSSNRVPTCGAIWSMRSTCSRTPSGSDGSSSRRRRSSGAPSWTANQIALTCRHSSVPSSPPPFGPESGPTAPAGGVSPARIGEALGEGPALMRPGVSLTHSETWARRWACCYTRSNASGCVTQGWTHATHRLSVAQAGM